MIRKKEINESINGDMKVKKLSEVLLKLELKKKNSTIHK